MVTITDMDSGRHFHLGGEGHEHSHNHDHGRDHAHDHDHDHEHTHDHTVAGHGHNRHSAIGEGRRTIHLEEEVLAKNNRIAEWNRGWFSGRDILALNFLSAPGAGKTTLLERTIRDLHGELSLHVIEGDQATTHDAERIRAAGCRAIQINTGAGCHLDAAMVQAALGELNPAIHSTVFIENVGNLVCPALFDLGEKARVVIVSVTEGEDKPLKYPHMFRSADLVILSKIDLLPHVSFRVSRFQELLAQVNSATVLIEASATTGAGLSAWYDWVRQKREV